MPLDFVTDELLDVELVIFLQGNNMFGDPAYSYIVLSGQRLRWLFDAIQSGHNFKPSDYGDVIIAGVGEPPPDVRDIMRTKYNMMDVPEPPAEADQPTGTENADVATWRPWYRSRLWIPPLC